MIRLGLLELALGEVPDAVRRLEHAKKLFSSKGCLTDQEFLNSLLCDFILQVALSKMGRDMNLPSIHTIEISHCKSVDERDIRCVQRDARYLRMYLEKLGHNDIKPDSMKCILDNLDQFIEKRLEPLEQIASSSYNE